MLRNFNTLSMLFISVFGIKQHHNSAFSMTPSLCFPSHVGRDLLFTENPGSRGGELLVDLPDQLESAMGQPSLPNFPLLN